MLYSLDFFLYFSRNFDSNSSVAQLHIVTLSYFCFCILNLKKRVICFFRYDLKFNHSCLDSLLYIVSNRFVADVLAADEGESYVSKQGFHRRTKLIADWLPKWSFTCNANIHPFWGHMSQVRSFCTHSMYPFAL